MGKKVIPVVTSADTDVMRRPPQALIRILHADGQLEERSLDIGSYDVGRTSGDIVLPGDRAVSRLHARLNVTPTGVIITDLGSTSGTFDARGARLEQPLALGPNDSVRIGHATLSVIRLVVLGPSGVQPGLRPTEPAIPAALQHSTAPRRRTLPAIPAAMRKAVVEGADPGTSEGLPRESIPAHSGTRTAKQRRKSEEPPPK